GVPVTINEAKLRSLAHEFIQAAHSDWTSDQVDEQVNYLVAHVVGDQKLGIPPDPELQRVFALSQEKKNDFLFRVILNVLASGVNLGAAGQDWYRQEKIKNAREAVAQFIHEEDHTRDLIDLSLPKWQDILHQFSAEDRKRFIRVMGAVFTDGTS